MDPTLGSPGCLSQAWPWLLLSLVLVVVAAVYWPGRNGGFVFDDYPNIVFNTKLHATQLVWNQWSAAIFSSPASDLPRPLAMLSFAVNHFLTGLDPRPMKLTNLGIHLLNTVLVFGLVRQLLQTTGAARTATHWEMTALFVASGWALMPINLMAVLLVVQRMESLSHTFVFLGLWLYLAGRNNQLAGKSGWGQILSGLLVCGGLGMLSKESAALLPVYAFCVEVFLLRFGGREGEQQSGLKALFCVVLLIPALLGLAWILPRVLDPGAYAHRNFTLVQRLLTEPRIVLDYLHWIVVPDLGQLSLFHDDYPVSTSFWNPVATLAGWIVLPILVVAGWRVRRIRPLTSLGLAWFFGAHLLTAGIIPLELMFEHRNYFASLGVSLVLADLLLIAPAAPDRLRFGWVIAVSLLLFYGSSTHFRALEWSDPLRFAQSEAAKHPQSPRATYNLAQSLAVLSRGDANSPLTNAAFAAFERARQVPDANIAPAQGALLLAARAGKPLKAEWWRDIQTRLRNQPIGPQELGALGSLTTCAIATRCNFPVDEMLETYTAALSQGDDPEVLNLYGNYALNILGDVQLAERLWTEASRLSPKEPQYVMGLAKLKIALGRYDEASAHINHLRSMGKLGQYNDAADALDARMEAAAGTESGPGR